MWKRFTRLLQSIFGGAISAMEDPKLILEQNIRELNDQVPKMNENIATVKANVMLLQKEDRRYTAEQAGLTSKVRAAIAAGRDDIAQRYAVQLQGLKEAQARTGEQLQFAEQAYEKSLQVKKVFMREREKKIGEAKEALRAHERAKWQSKIADTLEQFEVAGVDSTHDEMLRRVNEQTAKNEARMEMALDSIDTEAMAIEEDAKELEGAELVRQFKLEMGLEGPAPTPATAAPERTPALDTLDSLDLGADAPAGRPRTRTE